MDGWQDGRKEADETWPGSPPSLSMLSSVGRQYVALALRFLCHLSRGRTGAVVAEKSTFVPASFLPSLKRLERNILSSRSGRNKLLPSSPLLNPISDPLQPADHISSLPSSPRSPLPSSQPANRSSQLFFPFFSEAHLRASPLEPSPSSPNPSLPCFPLLYRCQWGTPPVAATSQTYGTWLGHCSRKAGITITNGSLPTNLTTVRSSLLPLPSLALLAFDAYAFSYVRLCFRGYLGGSRLPSLLVHQPNNSRRVLQVELQRG